MTTGPHDPFCFTCGVGGNIVGCQTCARCYHAHCMYPPLDQGQVPDVWFCPVCVARNWHQQLPQIQTPIKLPVPSAAPTLPQDFGTMREKQNTDEDPAGLHTSNHTPSGLHIDEAIQNHSWTDAQRYKQNAKYTPRGYILDPSTDEKFLCISGDGPPSISLNTVLQSRAGTSDKAGNIERKGHDDIHRTTSFMAPSVTWSSTHRTEREDNKPPPRKRSKYSDLPKDIEKAMNLIAAQLEGVSKNRKYQDDIENKSRALEQKVKIQEGEVHIYRQELQCLKQKLANKSTETEKLRTGKAEIWKQLQDSRALSEARQNEMEKWQSMLRSMIYTRENSNTNQ
jgi:hypothetical protein